MSITKQSTVGLSTFAPEIAGLLKCSRADVESKFVPWQNRLRPKYYETFEDALLATMKNNSQVCEVAVVVSINREALEAYFRMRDDRSLAKQAEKDMKTLEWLNPEESEAALLGLFSIGFKRF